MADVSWKIEGLDLLLKKLDAVSYDLKHKGGRAALRKAANVVLAAARAGAMRFDDPETARSIVKNLALRWNNRLFRQTGNLGFRVGVMQGAVLKRGGDKGAGAPTPHWRLLEFGTERMPAQPFMRPALEQNLGKATDVFVSEYIKAIDRAIKRGQR